MPQNRGGLLKNTNCRVVLLEFVIWDVFLKPENFPSLTSSQVVSDAADPGTTLRAAGLEEGIRHLERQKLWIFLVFLFKPLFHWPPNCPSQAKLDNCTFYQGHQTCQCWLKALIAS